MQALNLSEFNEGIAYHADLEAFAHINWQDRIYFVSYGIKIGIRVNESTILPYVQNYLPPGWRPSSDPFVDKLYSLIVSETDYQLYRHTEKIAQTPKLEEILEAFDSDLRLEIGISAQDKLFVHAGVVGWRGRAIVIPGRSFSGKTTLVAALVQAGATYYSDEYAVLDGNGLVHPYPRALSIRQREGQGTKRCPVEALGGIAGEKALPIGLVVQTHYQSGALWNPQAISSGQAVLTLLDNTLVACQSFAAQGVRKDGKVCGSICSGGFISNGEFDESCSSTRRTSITRQPQP